MTRDLVVEEFGEIEVTWLKSDSPCVTLHFADAESAKRAYFVIKNALELGIPVQIRAGKE